MPGFKSLRLHLRRHSVVANHPRLSISGHGCESRWRHTHLWPKSKAHGLYATGGDSVRVWVQVPVGASRGCGVTAAYRSPEPTMRVQFPSTPYGRVAKWLRHTTDIRETEGSTPFPSTICCRWCISSITVCGTVGAGATPALQPFNHTRVA